MRRSLPVFWLMLLALAVMFPVGIALVPPDEVHADTTAPTIGPDHTVTTAEAGESVTVNVTISDYESGVSNASAEYWTGNGTHRYRTLRLVSGNRTTGLWQGTIRSSWGPLEGLHYIIHAFDRSNNIAKTETRNITLIDTTAPRVYDYAFLWKRPTTGDPCQFACNVSDQVGIEEVRLEYEIGDWLDVNVTMELMYDHGYGNGQYVHNTTIPSNCTDTMSYSYFATDTSGNGYGISYDINITDNDPPEIINDSSDTSGTTGDVFHLQVTVTDNIAVSHASVNIWIGVNQFIDRNMVLIDEGIDYAVFECNVTMPNNRTGSMWYSFHLVDWWGNWNTSLKVPFDVIDDEPPVLITDGSHEEEEAFRFVANVSDNVGVEEVWVEYTIKGQVPVNLSLEAMDIDATGNGTYGGVQIPVPVEQQIDLKYTIGVRDTSGLVDSVQGTYTSLDLFPPVFEGLEVDGVPVKGWSVTISVRTWDDQLLEEVWLEHWFGDGGRENVTLEPDGDLYSRAIEIPRWPDGDLHYAFHAYDAKDNWNTTGVRTIAVENRLPHLDALTWQVVEGELEILDLALRITDENDGLGTITVSTDVPWISVDRLRLSCILDAWMPPQLVNVTVSDGEDATVTQISVVITNVNDLPVLTSTPVIGASVGTPYEYQVTFEDEDPEDVHIYSLEEAPEGMEVSSQGLVTWTPAPGQEGAHMVKLVIDDGTATVHQTWQVTVLAPANRPPSFTNTPTLAHTAGTTYTWTAEAEDPDGDELTFSVIRGPAGASFGEGTATLSWDPPLDRRGTTADIEITVRVSDGDLHADIPFTLVVTYPEDQPPVVTWGASQRLEVEGTTVVDLQSFKGDPDDTLDALQWVATTNSDLFTAEVAGDILIITPDEDARGSGKVTLELVDPWGGSDSVELTVEVDTEEGAGSSLGWWVSLALLVVVVLLVLMLLRERAAMTQPRDSDESDGAPGNDDR